MAVSPSYLKTLLLFLPFSFKPPSSSLSTMKIKSLIRTLVYAQVRRLIRAISKAKSSFIQFSKDNKSIQYLISNARSTKKKYKRNNLMFGSFRLHYNWCSSHVTPVPAPVLAGCTTVHPYYDSSWGTVISGEQCEEETAESELSGYLEWLEEKKVNGNCREETESDLNDIDKLAEIFIANCHEKFRLEKEESYRRFQEMMARSL